MRAETRAKYQSTGKATPGSVCPPSPGNALEIDA